MRTEGRGGRGLRYEQPGSEGRDQGKVTDGDAETGSRQKTKGRKLESTH